MQIRHKAYAHSLLALLFAPVVGCGAGSPHASNLSTSGPSGKVTQGPVSGSTVWADNLASGTQFVLDSAEQSTQTTTGSTGAFTLPETPTYKYVLISQGGTDTITGRTALTLMAPAGSQSISPLTTLVALDTTGKLATSLNSLLPVGRTFDSDLTAVGALSPAAMVLLTSTTTAATAFDATIQIAASKSGANLTTRQRTDISFTLLSEIAGRFSSLQLESLSNTANVASNLQTALCNAITTVAAGNTNIAGLNACVIAATIANNSVAIAANLVGNATGDTALKSVTSSNVETVGVTASTSSTVTEALVMSSGNNTQILNNAINTVAASTATGVTITSTPSAYSPAKIAVISNPTVIGYKLAVNQAANMWNVSSFTITFSDDMVATTSGSNYAHSVLNPANYQFTQAGCSPSSYASDVVTFKCADLQSGTFGVKIARSSASGGVWASATSLGLPVDNSKTFILQTVTGSTSVTLF